MLENKHTFVICAYEKSLYLDECLKTIMNQNIESNIILVTSTPNELISELADRYSIKLYVNKGEKGITQDWNFALRQVKTRYATIVHQDDCYEKDYLDSILKNIIRNPNALIAFTDYYEIHAKTKIFKNAMLIIKKIMLFPLNFKILARSRIIRRIILSFGNPICCPSVTYCLDKLEQPIFQNTFQSNEDWEAWEKISKMKGEFIYINRPLVGHRIHDGSTTTKTIENKIRKKENYIMFCKFWPKPLANLVNYFYTKAEKFNRV